MRVVIAGGHGSVARHLARLLTHRGDTAVGLIRNPDQAEDLRADGAEPVVLDLESASVEAVAEALAGADAAVFAAGAGPGSGTGRKDSVDRAGAVLLASAGELGGVRRHVQVSSLGTESVRDGARPEGVDEAFLAYLRAKLAAEDDLRRRDLDWTVLRPGLLLDDPATGRVRVADRVGQGAVTRQDVAATLLALLDTPGSAGRVLEVVGGDDEPLAAVHAAAAGLRAR